MTSLLDELNKSSPEDTYMYYQEKMTVSNMSKEITNETSEISPVEKGSTKKFRLGEIHFENYSVKRTYSMQYTILCIVYIHVLHRPCNIH